MTPQTPTQVSREALRQLDLLKAQRNALTDQLQSQTIRQDYLNQQLAKASGPAVGSLQAQLAEVQSSVKATNDALARVDDAVNKAIMGGLPTTPVAGQNQAITRSWEIPAKVGTIGTAGIVAMMVILLTSMRRRRYGGAPQPQQLSHADSARLDQLQRAVDTIAIEVERISESQRFIARNVAEEKKTPS